MDHTLNKIESWLRDARERRLWGQLVIDVKEGSAYLMRATIQTQLHNEDQTRREIRK
jgi:hypothetical protein